MCVYASLCVCLCESALCYFNVTPEIMNLHTEVSLAHSLTGILLWEAGTSAFKPVVRQNIMAGAHCGESIHFMVDRK